MAARPRRGTHRFCCFAVPGRWLMASLTTILSVKRTMRLALVATLVSVACVSAQAQDAFLDFRSQVRPSAGKTPGLAQQATKGTLSKGDAKMLVRADEMSYDNANASIAAIGNVQIYYAGATLEADKVIYDQKTKRLHAEGNARLTEADGKVTYGEIIDMTDDFRDGFIDSLRVDTPDQTRMAATRADRSSG